MSVNAIQTEAKDLVAVVRQALADLDEVPPYEVSPGDYADWGDEGEFRVKVGKGECAG